MISLENIKPGMAVASYKDMCTLLQDKTVTKKELREKQIERWAAYIDFERRFNTFYIREIKAEIDIESVLQQMTHVDLYQVLLLHFLYETLSVDAALQPNGHDPKTPGLVQISQRELLYRLGVLNHFGKNRMLEAKDCEEEKEFFSVLKNKSYYTLLSAIDRLEKGKIIMAQNGYLLEFDAGRSTQRVRVSTKDENAAILSAYDTALRECGFVDMQEAFLAKAVPFVYKTANDILRDAYGILKHEECYTFLGIPNRLLLKLRKLKGGDFCRQLLKQRSNQNSAERMHKYKDRVLEVSEAAKQIAYTREKDNKRIVQEDYREKIEQYIERFIECSFL